MSVETCNEYFLGKYVWTEDRFDPGYLEIDSNRQTFEEAREALDDYRKRGENLSLWGAHPVDGNEPDDNTVPDLSKEPEQAYVVLHPPVRKGPYASLWVYRTPGS